MATDDKYWVLISRYLANDLSLDETEELLKWLDDDPARAGLLDELRKTWDKSREYPSVVEVDTTAAWNEVRQRITTGRTTEPKVRKLSSRWLSGIAACIVLLLAVGLGYWRFGGASPVTVQTYAGEQKKVILPDGSSVWLNELSRISYAPDFNEGKMRSIVLTGEAFFEVRHDDRKAFVVTAGNTMTQVLGTSFNVKHQKNGSVSVSVVTGKVSFWPKDENRQLLTLVPGNQGNYSPDHLLTQTKFSDTNFLYWKNRQLRFDNRPLREVVATLQSVYGVRFDVNDQDLLNKRITISFDQASLNQVCDILEAMLDLQIEQSGSTLVVERKK